MPSLVEHRADVVRVHAVDDEREHARLLARRVPIDADAGDRVEQRRAVREQLRLVARDALEAEAVEPVDRRAEADRAGDVGRARLEARAATPAKVVFSKRTDSIMSPPPCQGGIASSSSARA